MGRAIPVAGQRRRERKTRTRSLSKSLRRLQRHCSVLYFMAGDVRVRARATLRLARPTTANSSETQTPVPTSTFRPAINAPGRRARAGMPCLLQATTPQQRHHATAPRHAISVSAIYGGCSALHPNVIDVITYSGDATGRDGSARARRKGGRHAGSTENFPLSLSLSRVTRALPLYL